jgi:TRAP-type C4-dicarboxylate transport system substrate-binding protein
MSKNLLRFSVLLVLAAMLLNGCGGSSPTGDKPSAKSDNKVYKIKVADAFPATHFFTVNGLKKFMQLAEEKSKGRLVFEHYPGGQLGKQVDMLELVKNGVADMAFVGPSYVSGKLPLSNVFDLPGIYPNARVGAEAFWHLTQDVLYKEEYSKHKVRPVYALAYNPNDLFYNKKDGGFIKTPSDLKGMRIRVPGVSAEMSISAMGGAPVSIIPQEMYEAAYRGTVDGLVLAFEALDQYKVQEIVKYATKGVNVTGWIGSYCINERAWQSLPKDLQQVILDSGLEATRALGDYVTKSGADYEKKYIETAGMKVYSLSKQEQAVFADATKNVVENWVKTQEAKKLPASKILELTKAKVAEVEKSLEKK